MSNYEPIQDEFQKLREDLTLLLLYLNSWDEEYKPMKIKFLRSWKGFDFGTLNSLSDNYLISDSKKSKSITFTEDGVIKAKKLLAVFKSYIENGNFSE